MNPYLDDLPEIADCPACIELDNPFDRCPECARAIAVGHAANRVHAGMRFPSDLALLGIEEGDQ
jgi:hypothetical protein